MSPVDEPEAELPEDDDADDEQQQEDEDPSTAPDGVEWNGKVFHVSGGYPDLKRGLLNRGWHAATAGSHADFTWVCKRSEIDFGALSSPRMANHYSKIAQLCTKVGLTERLEEARGLCESDIDSFYPRTFHLVGHEPMDAFVTEFKLRKVEGILKEWVSHMKAGLDPTKTFHKDIVRIALDVATRHVLDIDNLLMEEENEAEFTGSFVTESEWAVLSEVDVACPSKEINELELQRQARKDQERNKEQVKAAIANQVKDLQRLRKLNQEKLAKKQQEKQRKEALRKKLAKAVLKASSAASGGVAGAQNTFLAQVAEGGEGQDSSQKAQEEPLSPAQASDGSQPSSPSAEKEQSTEPSAEELQVLVCEVLAAWKRSNPQFAINGCRDVWILKPAGRARGEGIFLSSSVEDILKLSRSQRGLTTWICQKYIENPLLIKDRKHDLRQWVLVTSWNPLTAYMYDECYVRLAADKYETDNISNNMSHLTNNCVASNHAMFDKEDDYWQCMWTQERYRRFIQSKYGNDAWQTKVRPAMKQAILDTLVSVQESLAESEAVDHCFELLGYDFMVDTDLGVWLLEVNTSPSMEHSTSITAELVPQVLEDTLKVVLEDGPPEAPYGRFEPLRRGAEIFQDGPPAMTAAARSLCLEGSQLRPPPPPAAPPTAKESSKQLAERRAQELSALAEKQQQRKEKERLKKEKSERVRAALRRKVLSKAQKDPVQDAQAEPLKGQSDVDPASKDGDE